MALNIKNPDTERLAHRLAEATGESLTDAVTVALRERLASLERATGERRLLESVRSIQAVLAGLPDRDRRAPDEILGYDAHGLPS